MYIERFPVYWALKAALQHLSDSLIHTLIAEAAMQGDNCSSGGRAGNRTSNLPITRLPALPPDHKQELLQLLRPFEERLKDTNMLKETM